MSHFDLSVLILDVDGVLTDGGLWFDSESESSKRFHVQDGAAIKHLQQHGWRLAIISGRSSAALQRRAGELGISSVQSGVVSKLEALQRIIGALGIDATQAAYMGDDLPDVPPMVRCGFPIAVANAVPAVKRVARLITRRSGGHGAVAEAAEYLLRLQGRWTAVVAE